MAKLKKITAVFLLLVITFLTASCTSSKDEDLRGRTYRLKKQNILTLSVPDKLESLDPINIKNLWEFQVASMVHDGLVTYLKDTKMIIPALASQWEVSPNGRSYHFILREGLSFHSGNEVTAEDVKFSWERALKLGNPEVLAVFGNILGAEEYYQGKAPEVSGIEVIDKRNFKVHLKTVDAGFLLKITDPVAYILDQQALEPRGQGAETSQGALELMIMAGAGPFNLVERQPYNLVLEKFRPHYLENNLERIEVMMEPEAELALKEFLGGQVDIMQLEEPLSDFLLSRDEGLNDGLREIPRAEILYLGFNTQKTPYNDATLRQLINLALDRERLAQSLGNYEPASGFLPRSLLEERGPLQAYFQDLSETQNLVPLLPEESKNLTLYFVAEDKNKELAEMIQEQLAQVGLNIRLQSLNSLQELSYGLKTGSIGFYLHSWTAKNYDPHGFLTLMFHSSSSHNVTGYENEVVDGYLNYALGQELNSRERITALLEAEKIIMQESPAITLLEKTYFLLAGDRVSQLILDPLRGLFWENIKVD